MTKAIVYIVIGLLLPIVAYSVFTLAMYPIFYSKRMTFKEYVKKYILSEI